jgi:maltodextrin utilization protein YvdJ
MFLVRFFKYSFQFKEMLYRPSEKFWKVLIYFLLISMIALFPMNYQIVREEGFRLDFIYQDFLDDTPLWVLPEDCVIEGSKLYCDTNIEYIYTHKNVTYIFNYQNSQLESNKSYILLKEQQILYVNQDGNLMTAYDYQGFEEEVNFRSINLMDLSERKEALIHLAYMIENSFSPYIILFAILVNTIVNIGLYMIFILFLSLILQLFRFGYSKFFPYIDSLKFLVYAMGAPAVISFFVGLIEPSIGTVIFHFGVGIITMLVMLFYGKKVFA